MKNFFSMIAVALTVFALSSCSSVRHTSTTVDVDTKVVAAATADLNVSSKKISYTLKPSSAVKRSGEKNVIKTAVAEALKANGNADVLVGFQYEIKRTRNFFGCSRIKYVTVEGYPATYQNFKNVK